MRWALTSLLLDPQLLQGLLAPLSLRSRRPQLLSALASNLELNTSYQIFSLRYKPCEPGLEYTQTASWAACFFALHHHGGKCARYCSCTHKLSDPETENIRTPTCTVDAPSRAARRSDADFTEPRSPHAPLRPRPRTDASAERRQNGAHVRKTIHSESGRACRCRRDHGEETGDAGYCRER